MQKQLTLRKWKQEKTNRLILALLANIILGFQRAKRRRKSLRNPKRSIQKSMLKRRWILSRQLRLTCNNDFCYPSQMLNLKATWASSTKNGKKTCTEVALILHVPKHLAYCRHQSIFAALDKLEIILRQEMVTQASCTVTFSLSLEATDIKCRLTTCLLLT